MLDPCFREAEAEAEAGPKKFKLILTYMGVGWLRSVWSRDRVCVFY